MTNILPEQPEDAVKEMIKITESLTEDMEAETNAAAMNDAVNFSMAEQNKQKSAQVYQQAAAEFHARNDEFKTVDVELIQKLEQTQHALGAVTQQNLKMLKKIPGVQSND